MIDIEVQDKNNIKIVLIEGKMNTTSSPEVEVCLTQLIDEGANNILLNLEEVDFISSTGLRVILVTGKKLKTVGGKIVMCGLNQTLQEVFRMSGFSTMFDVLETEEEAIKVF